MSRVVRCVTALALAYLIAACGGEEKRQPNAHAPDEAVISDLAGMTVSLDEFDLCAAVESIPEIEARLSSLTGTKITGIEAYPEPLHSRGQECYVRTPEGYDAAIMTFGASQGPDEHNAVKKGDPEIYPGCFASWGYDPGHGAGLGVRCRASFGVGVSAGVKYTKWPEQRAAYIELVADILESLSTQG